VIVISNFGIEIKAKYKNKITKDYRVSFGLRLEDWRKGL